MTTTAVSNDRKLAHRIRRTIGGGVRIYVSDVRGTLWASNSYWAQPLTTGDVRFLWTDHAPEPGTYETATNDKGAAVVRVDDSAPNLAHVIPAGADDEGKAIEVDRAKLEGIEVFCRTHDGQPAPLYRVGDGPLFGVDPSFLALLAGDGAEVTVTTTENYDGKPLTVWRRTSYTSLRNGKQAGRIFAGILMPIRPPK